MVGTVAVTVTGFWIVTVCGSCPKASDASDAQQPIVRISFFILILLCWLLLLFSLSPEPHCITHAVGPLSNHTRGAGALLGRSRSEMVGLIPRVGIRVVSFAGSRGVAVVIPGS